MTVGVSRNKLVRQGNLRLVIRSFYTITSSIPFWKLFNERDYNVRREYGYGRGQKPQLS